jgi:gas vesicle protein
VPPHIKGEKLRKNSSLVPFLTGVGVGIVATVLFVPEAGRKTRARIADFTGHAADALKDGARNLRAKTEDLLQEGKSAWRDQENKGRESMSDLKDKTKDEIDDVADAAKKAAGKVIDTTKDVAHSAGKKLEEGGKRLQDA